MGIQMRMQAQQGYPFPLGASQRTEGINFALFSGHAKKVTLCLFLPGKTKPLSQIPLDPKINKTGKIWHILLQDLPPKIEYGYSIDGLYSVKKGYFFNPSFFLVDPYARSLNLACTWGQTTKEGLKGRIVSPPPFDWGEDRPPQIPMKDLIIYEMHVRGFTQHPSSGVVHPGTFLGIIEKIPYFKQLGINAIELLPIFEFDECENKRLNPITGEKLFNYWGYSTMNFFSPMKRYATSFDWGAAMTEFKQLVKALHQNGIEIILDVVYNHTGEGGMQDFTFSFRGIDNPVYYMIDDEGEYRDYTGCGHTFNCNHPVASKLILDSLRYWVSEMHIDGFRFDLASVLTRDEDGEALGKPPLIAAISRDPLLANVKLIAEAWDAGGLYQVGSFPYGKRWAEWNGKYRDLVRDFIKGTPGCAGDFARAFCGSEDLYGKVENPYHSINFITAHDGFTLKDLVSYQEKHNEANGEENKDGTSDHRSWNCGEEGETENKEIILLREKQQRNFMLALLLSLGTPMLLMGDEYGHTRRGNNNPWCQDNDINWFLWEKLEAEKGFYRFCALLIDFRKKHTFLKPEGFYKQTDLDWHGEIPFEADWSSRCQFVALTLKDHVNHNHLYIAFNAQPNQVSLKLPLTPTNKSWFRCIDTAEPSPKDFIENPAQFPAVESYLMEPYSALVLQAL
jgi:isoamylase